MAGVEAVLGGQKTAPNSRFWHEWEQIARLGHHAGPIFHHAPLPPTRV